MLVYTRKLASRSSQANDNETYDLLDDLARGVEVDQTLVDLELVTVPGLRTLTARLDIPASTRRPSSLR